MLGQAAGAPSGALLLNGQNAYVSVTDLLLFGSSDFTINCRFSEASRGPIRQLAGAHGTSLPNHGVSWLLLSDDGYLLAQLYSGSTAYAARSSVRHTLADWHDATVVRAGGTVQLYLNGSAVASVSVGAASVNAAGLPVSVGAVMINATTPDNYWFHGAIDELVIHDVALYAGNFTPPGPVPYTPWTVGFSRAAEALRYSPYEDGPPVFSQVPPTRRLIENTEYGGRGTVVGTVARKGTPNAPLARRVRLLRDRDAVMVGETWSNTAGQFAFPYLDASETYTALAYDHTGEFESVCASRLIAEVI